MRGKGVALALVLLAGLGITTQGEGGEGTVPAAAAGIATQGTGYKFSVGETICCRIEETVTTTTVMSNGWKQEGRQSHHRELRWTVQEIDAKGTAHLVPGLVRGEAPPGLPPGLPPGFPPGLPPDIASAAGVEFELRISPLGEIVAVAPCAESQQKIIKSPGGQVARRSDDEDEQKAMATEWLIAFPAQWDKSQGAWSSVYALGGSKMVRAYTPLGYETCQGQRALKIGLKQEVKLDRKSRPADTAVAEMPGMGVAYYDPAKGRLLEMTIETPSQMVVHTEDGDTVQTEISKKVLRLSYVSVQEAGQPAGASESK